MDRYIPLLCRLHIHVVPHGTTVSACMYVYSGNNTAAFGDWICIGHTTSDSGALAGAGIRLVPIPNSPIKI